MFTYEVYANDQHLYGYKYESLIDHKTLNKRMFMFDWELLLKRLKEKEIEFGTYKIAMKFSEQVIYLYVDYLESDIIFQSNWKKEKK